MRIAFVGKGGSGKTTAVAMFSRHVAEHSHRVVAIDADINQHLAQGLGHAGRGSRQLDLGPDDAVLCGSRPASAACTTSPRVRWTPPASVCPAITPRPVRSSSTSTTCSTAPTSTSWST
jgi:hypothetical protein